MALSDREKQVLAEMERELFGTSTIDPKLPAANSPARLIAGVLVAVIGLSVLVFAAISTLVWFGVIGFAITLSGVLAASATPRGRTSQPGSEAKPSGSGPKGSNSKASGRFSSYFSDRWDRRQGN